MVLGWLPSKIVSGRTKSDGNSSLMARWAKNKLIRNKNRLWWPCLLTDWDAMNNLRVRWVKYTPRTRIHYIKWKYIFVSLYIEYSQSCPCGHLYWAVTYIKRSPFFVKGNSWASKYVHVRTVFTFSTMFPGTKNIFLASYSPKFALSFQRSFYLNCEQNIAYVNKYFLKYDYFMGLFEFVVGEWICWRCHNTNPDYQE
jgi:hypothetical protein